MKKKKAWIYRMVQDSGIKFKKGYIGEQDYQALVKFMKQKRMRKENQNKLVDDMKQSNHYGHVHHASNVSYRLLSPDQKKY